MIYRLLVPFMRVGELVTGGDHYSISSSGLWDAFRKHEPEALVFGVLHAVRVFLPFLSDSFLYLKSHRVVYSHFIQNISSEVLLSIIKISLGFPDHVKSDYWLVHFCAFFYCSSLCMSTASLSMLKCKIQCCQASDSSE